MKGNQTVQQGRRGEYWWLCLSAGRLHDVLSISPGLVQNRYVAVAALDGGPMKPTPQEIEAGWEVFDDTAWSPLISSASRVSEIPMGEYDEWWVFDERARIKVPQERFVNYGDFTPDEARSMPAMPQDSGWDLAAARADHEDRLLQTALFWHRVEEVRPFAVLMERDAFMMICRDPQHLHSLVGDAEA